MRAMATIARSTCRLAASLCLSLLGLSALAAGDPARGANVFQACASCHSTKEAVQLTGPSLANIWHRKAASVAGFSRYSDPLKKADIVWNDETLDKWLADPDALVPGT